MRTGAVDRFAALRAAFAPEGVEVVWDRRVGERRRSSEPGVAGVGAPRAATAAAPSRRAGCSSTSSWFPPALRVLLAPASAPAPGRRAPAPQRPIASRSARASGRSLIDHSAGFVGAVSSSTAWSSLRASAVRPCFRRTLARPTRSGVKCGSTSRPLRKWRLRALQAAAEEPRDLVVDVPGERVGGGQTGVELERLPDRLAYLRQEEQGTQDAPRLAPAAQVDPVEEVGERSAGRQLDRPPGRLPALGVGGELLLGGGGPHVAPDEAGAGERGPGLRDPGPAAPPARDRRGRRRAARGSRGIEWRGFRAPRRAATAAAAGPGAPSDEEQGGGGREGARQHVAPGQAAAVPWRSLKRWILPVAVLGSSGTKSIQRGYL